MLDFMRKRKQARMIQVLFLIIIFVFIFWGFGNPFSDDPAPNSVASRGGRADFAQRFSTDLRESESVLSRSV